MTQNSFKERNIVFKETQSGFLRIKISKQFEVDDYQEIVKLLLDYSKQKNLTHLVIILDLSQLVSISYEARKAAYQNSTLKEINLDLIFLNLRPDLKASLQFLFINKKYLRYYDSQNTEEAIKKAIVLVNERNMDSFFSGPSVLTGIRKRSFRFGNKEFTIIQDKKWSYQDANENYHYEIELIDSNIFISRPSGSIEFDHSLHANVLFDKVVYEILGHDDFYYRIQDYSDVLKTSYSAKRDFTNYIIKNIDRINLMVFFGLNQSMKAIVKIGKLVHPSFSKVKIANSFDEAIALIMENKYGSEFVNNEFGVLVQNGKINVPNNQDTQQIESEHQKEIQNIFEYIGKILWTPDRIDHPVSENENYSEIYQALNVLKNDIDEIISKKDHTISHMQKQLFELGDEIKKYRQEIRNLNTKRKDFIKDIHYEIRTPIQSILTAGELYQLDKSPQSKKESLSIILDSSKELSVKMFEQTERILKNQNSKDVTTSLFNLNNHIKKKLASFKSIADAKEIELVLKTGTIEDYFIGDLHKLNSILEHLILNAIQNSAKGRITVEAELVEHYVTSQKIRISVKDQGYGLDHFTENLIGRIFNGDQTKGFELSIHSFGSGLLVCQQLAELMDGKMLYSSLESGSMFGFEVVLDLGVFSKELNLLNRTTSLKHLKLMDLGSFCIAFWEQNKDDYKTELMVLNQLGIQVLVIKSKDELSKLLFKKSIDLLFFEFFELEDVYATSSYIKDLSSNKNIKICGLTTNVSMGLSELESCKVLDFNLIKPFSIKKLVDIIKGAYYES